MYDSDGNSLVVQWFGLRAFTRQAQVPSLVVVQAVQCSQSGKKKYDSDEGCS